MVTAIILAAGCSTRLGTAKQLLSFRDQPIIRIVTENVLKSSVDQVIVVVGYQAQAVAEAIRDLPVTVIFNPNYSEGQSTSLKAGLQAYSNLHAGLQAYSSLHAEQQACPHLYPRQNTCAANANGILFVLGDQPLVESTTIDLLINSFHLQGEIVLPYFEDRQGNPTLFGEQYLPELLAMKGDSGGREIIRRHPEQVVKVDVTDAGVCQDIDTWEDYLNLK